MIEKLLMYVFFALPVLTAVIVGAVRVRNVYTFQRPQSWKVTDPDGNVMIITSNGELLDRDDHFQIGGIVLRPGDRVEKVTL